MVQNTCGLLYKEKKALKFFRGTWEDGVLHTKHGQLTGANPTAAGENDQSFTEAVGSGRLQKAVFFRHIEISNGKVKVEVTNSLCASGGSTWLQIADSREYLTVKENY